MAVRAVFLVGFMASGKSSVGMELARRLDWDFMDLDAWIESHQKQSVPEIFRESGECGFRLIETAALRGLLSGTLKHDVVVALGGGAFAQEQNRALLREWPTVFLEAPVAELWKRSLADGVERPLRRDPEQFAQLYAERSPLYREASIEVHTTGKPLASICAEIESALNLKVNPKATRHTGNTRSGTGESK
jgi:shikimate kinase